MSVLAAHSHEVATLVISSAAASEDQWSTNGKARENKQTYRRTDTDRQTGRQADRQTDRQTDRQADSKTDRQTGRQADRRTDRRNIFRTCRPGAKRLGVKVMTFGVRCLIGCFAVVYIPGNAYRG